MALEMRFAKERHPKRWIFLITLVLILGAGGWFAYKWYTEGETLPVPIAIASADTQIDESDVSDQDMTAHVVDNLVPRYLSIPTLGVKARVQPVSFDDNNILNIPTNINDVGWYDKSSTPGDGGVIVIDGHAKGINKNGAFIELSSMKEGSEIIIERGDGVSFAYTVVDVVTVSVDEYNETTVKTLGTPSVTGSEALNIVTFDGNWVPRINTFERRIVVYATIAK